VCIVEGKKPWKQTKEQEQEQEQELKGGVSTVEFP
jgi:hypothetical protein